MEARRAIKRGGTRQQGGGQRGRGAEEKGGKRGVSKGAAGAGGSPRLLPYCREALYLLG